MGVRFEVLRTDVLSATHAASALLSCPRRESFARVQMSTCVLDVWSPFVLAECHQGIQDISGTVGCRAPIGSEIPEPLRTSRRFDGSTLDQALKRRKFYPSQVDRGGCVLLQLSNPHFSHVLQCRTLMAALEELVRWLFG